MRLNTRYEPAGYYNDEYDFDDYVSDIVNDKMHSARMSIMEMAKQTIEGKLDNESIVYFMCEIADNLNVWIDDKKITSVLCGGKS